MKDFPVLYKYNSNGSVNTWQIFVNGSTFYTTEGIQEGKLTTSLPTQCESKNIGKKNETSGESQALKQAEAKHKKKKDLGYNEILTTEKPFFSPMLAEDYADYLKLVSNAFKDNINVFVQRKYDGFRCISKNNELTSRKGIKYVSCPHLQQNEVILDGELYSHKGKENPVDFEKLCSIIRKSKPTDNDLAESKRIVRHWLYDFPEYPNLVFSERIEKLEEYLGLNCYRLPYFKLVETYQVFSETDILEYHEKFVEEGYEGTIIRLDLKGYEDGKRVKQVLKHKDFQDDEYIIINVLEGIGNRIDTVGKLVFQHGETDIFEAAVNGTVPYLKQLWRERDSLIGKSATVKHQGFLTSGKPRFPKVKDIGRESHE